MVTINARKYDGTIHRAWKAVLKEKKGSLLLFAGEFEESVKHADLGFIRRGTVSYEYYWLDRWYNVFRFHEPNGDFRNYYCNINMPPTFKNSILDYVDLDIDILVWKDKPAETLDQDEYLANSVKFNYSEEVTRNVQLSIETLSALIKKREFPFNRDL